jgi:hypothetical protein
VLVAAFPSIFNQRGDFNQLRQNAEIFAELFATEVAGYEDYSSVTASGFVYGVDVIFGTFWPSATQTDITPGYGLGWRSPFACTAYLVYYLAYYGINPDESSYGSNRQALNSSFPIVGNCN